MANQTPKEMFKTLVTPRGAAEWAHLVEPDTKWKELGEYKTNLTVSREAALPFIEGLLALKDQGLKFFQADADEEAKAKGRKGKVLNLSSQDPWVENEDGTFTFKLKRDAKKIKEDGSVQEFKVHLLDATGREIPEADRSVYTNIGNGSIICAKVTAYPYSSPMIGVGVTLRLEKVQIINLVTYQAGGGVDTDFETVEGGYIHNAGVDSDFPSMAAQAPAPQAASVSSEADIVV